MESDTLGDDPRVTPATQGPPYRDPEAPSDAVSGEAHASGCHGSPGVAAERAEVDLPVSGLKPDWPRSASTWYRAGGRGPLGSCRWSRSRGNGPQQANTRPSADPAEGLGFGRTRMGLQTGGFLWNGRRSAGGESGVSPTGCRRTSRLRTQKSPANADLFESGLKGFEPSTFCMASGTWDPERPKKALQSTGFRAIGDQRCFPAFAAKSQGFPD
jgi:hypothetical protein